jgi:arginase
MADQFILTPYFLDQYLPKLSDLAQPHWKVIQEQLPESSPQRGMAALYETLAAAVSQTLTADHRPVSISGDCCATLGMAAGLQRAGIDFTLIWFDAHGDFNTWETSPSGFLGGMPLAMLAGRGEQTICNAIGLAPLAEESIILSDGRDLDSLEADAVRASALQHVKDLSQLGARVPAGPLYIHMDMDIINPKEAPAQNFVAPGGPSLREFQEVCSVLNQTGQIAAVSMSTWNPDLDRDGRTQQACLAALNGLLDPSSRLRFDPQE